MKATDLFTMQGEFDGDNGLFFFNLKILSSCLKGKIF